METNRENLWPWRLRDEVCNASYDDKNLSMVSGRFSAFEVHQASGERERSFGMSVGEILSIEGG